MLKRNIGVGNKHIQYSINFIIDIFYNDDFRHSQQTNAYKILLALIDICNKKYFNSETIFFYTLRGGVITYGCTSVVTDYINAADFEKVQINFRNINVLAHVNKYIYLVCKQSLTLKDTSKINILCCLSIYNFSHHKDDYIMLFFNALMTEYIHICTHLKIRKNYLYLYV